MCQKFIINQDGMLRFGRLLYDRSLGFGSPDFLQ
jgi:hypothetical protein